MIFILYEKFNSHFVFRNIMTKTIIAITFLATILLILPIASTPIYAPPPTFTVQPSGETASLFNGNCYAYIGSSAFGLNFPQMFSDAQTKSVNGIPGHLATYSNAAEELASDLTGSFARGLIGYTQDLNFATVPFTSGLPNPHANGYGWIDSTPATYSNWFTPGEPNDFGGQAEDYAENNWIGHGTFWNDRTIGGGGGVGYYIEFENCVPVDVDIDIKPGSDPSSVNCKNSKGTVPVAVFGSATFDVSTIDLNFLQLNGVDVVEVHDKLHIDDLNNDGFDDAVLHLDKAGVCDATSDYPLKDSEPATLIGSTTSGQPFEGTNDISIVKR